MSQSEVTIPPVVPAVVPPPAAPPVVPAVVPAVAAPVVPVVPSVVTEPADPSVQTWFKPRIEQAKRSGAAEKETEILAKLGVKTADEAVAVLAAHKAAEDAKKSEIQRLTEQNTTLSAQAARAAVLETTVKARADLELGLLTDGQRAAVAAIAGTDPQKMLSAIDTLKPTWVVAAPPATPVVPAAAPVTPAPAATTSPAPTAPGPAPNLSPPDYKAEYERLKAGDNPVAASAYLNAYSQLIYPRK